VVTFSWKACWLVWFGVVVVVVAVEARGNSIAPSIFICFYFGIINTNSSLHLAFTCGLAYNARIDLHGPLKFTILCKLSTLFPITKKQKKKKKKKKKVPSFWFVST
jgi:hypothetical protein